MELRIRADTLKRKQRVNWLIILTAKVRKDENTKNAKPLQFDGFYSLWLFAKPLAVFAVKNYAIIAARF